jgi:Ca-activated chloride channel family protein
MNRLPLIAAALLLGACSTSNPTSEAPAEARPEAHTPVAPPRSDAAAQAQPVAPAPAGKAETADMAPTRPRAAPAVSLMRREAKRIAPPAHPVQIAPAGSERYQALDDNPVRQVSAAPVSTFSIDVDTGSWANTRRLLNAGQLPPVDAVRVEEFINYFPYDYALPTDAHPFAVHTELARSPWRAGNLLMRVALKGQDMAKQSLPPANLVFLVDVSGSMGSPDKLPLLQSALKLLVQQMRPQDRIALVTYAGQAGVVLPATPGDRKATILAAIDQLQSGGSTAGASGIELAYATARAGFVEGGINRILLATDGDFNVGLTDFRQLKQMVERERASGIALSSLGFGTGNYNEQLMEQIADAGDGAYAYIDSLMEGHKVLVNEMTSTLATIARDVKIQVEFNPAVVKEYRLIGYENRQLAREDFNNDKVDAGDIGAGHTVTALYELTPVEAPGLIEPLRYGSDPRPAAARRDELAHVRLRYRQPGASASTLIERPVQRGEQRALAATSADFRFATAIAGFGQLLRGGKYTGQWQLNDARALAAGALGADRFGYRGEALRLMDLASALAPTRPDPTPPQE